MAATLRATSDGSSGGCAQLPGELRDVDVEDLEVFADDDRAVVRSERAVAERQLARPAARVFAELLEVAVVAAAFRSSFTESVTAPLGYTYWHEYTESSRWAS